ncbi:MAG: phosphoenolpyruvate carboxylase, partial [Mycobacteriales bacterium]
MTAAERTAAMDIEHEPATSVPEPLRRDVRLLGDTLGEVLRESGGDELLADVERLRVAVIAARRGASPTTADDVAEIVAGYDLDRAEQVARAFTVYFHLVNLAEERHRVRALRDQGQAAGAVRGSLAAAALGLIDAEGADAVGELVGRLRVQPVLTAHPTEARRRAIVSAIVRAGEQLDRFDDPRAATAELADARRHLLEEVSILWRTAQLRSTRPSPLDEVRTAMSVFDETLVRVVP